MKKQISLLLMFFYVSAFLLSPISAYASSQPIADQNYDNNGNVMSDGTWTHGWDYDDRLIGSSHGSSAINYSYGQDGNRLTYSDGTATTTYVNKYFNISNAGTITKNLFLGDQLIAAIEANGTSTNAYYVHTDHLGGTNVITGRDGAIVELLDYMPFGDVRIDERYGEFQEQKQFAGYEKDQRTGLNYLGARYYPGTTARFLSVDPVYNDIGNEEMIKSKTGLKIQQLLENPQALNSYSYAINNPLRLYDPNGEWFKEFFTRQQSWSNFQLELGEAAQTLYDTSAAGRTIMDHPYMSGAAIGVSSGLAAYGASAGITYGMTELGIISSTAGIQANKAMDYTQKFGQNLGSKMNQVAENLKNSTYQFSDHAIMRTAQRLGVGSESRLTNILNNVKPFEYFHDGVQKLGYYDATSKIFIGQVKNIGTITTVITETSQKYVNNLIK